MSISISIPVAETHHDVTRAQLWTSRVFATLAVLFLLFDATGKLLRPAPVVEGTVQLGWPASALLTLAILQLVCLALYLIPRTAVLGAILWTGYLGGAVATHLRLDNPLFSHILFPTYIAALLWGALWLRDRRLRELLPLRRSAN